MQKSLTEIQAIFLPATNDWQKFLFEGFQLGIMALLRAVFSDRVCVDLVLHKGKIILVL
jgi:hypothetical protein